MFDPKKAGKVSGAEDWELDAGAGGCNVAGEPKNAGNACGG